MVGAICCASAGAPALRVFGGVSGGALALVLVAFNGTVPMREGLVFLAVMLLGAAVRRAESGQNTWRCAACTAAVVLGLRRGGSAYGHSDGRHFTARGWIVAFLSAALTFGAGLALRRRRTPRRLTGLGTISYSVYLVHPVLLAVSDATVGRWRRDDPVLEAAFFAVLLPLCALTHRFIEEPGRTWGRRPAHRGWGCSPAER